jgi:rhodanese-related sulfurtransferase
LSLFIRVPELRKQAAGQAQLIDVRSPSEFAPRHIPGAVNIPMDQIEARLDDLRPGGSLVLICQSGKRARMTAGLLEPCRREILVLEGGTNAWVQEGLPTVTSVKTRWSLERQVRLGAGLLVLVGAVLAFTVNANWLFLLAFVGLGLTFAGVTDVCLMAEILERMPWNGQACCKAPGRNEEASKCVE